MLSAVNEEKVFHEVVEQRYALQNKWHTIVITHGENKIQQSGASIFFLDRNKKITS